MPEATPVPVTVLTGYLGAGKTTLLNRILSENHGKKFAVVINEFGELGVDNDLVVDADEEVFEMNNGCICCTVRGDLIRIIGALMKRKGDLDGIIIETTGLADPAPVAQTFFVDEDVKARTRLDAIVTVVDAKNLAARLADSREAEEQIAFADIVLLNKMDLVSAEEAEEVERRIRAINPTVEIRRSTKAEVPLEAVLGREAFNLARILEREPEFLSGEDEHEHDFGGAVAFLRGEAPDRPGEVQRLDQRPAGDQGPGPAADQGHPALPRRRPALRLPGGAHDGRWRLRRALARGRPAPLQDRLHRPRPEPAAAAAGVRRVPGGRVAATSTPSGPWRAARR